MTDSRWQEVEELFNRAVDLPPEDVDAFLASQTEDEELLREVRSLIASAAEDDRLIEDVIEDAAAPEPPKLGRRVGPYRLLQVLGTGGMGTVFLAERDDAEFEQKVAIKVSRRDLAGSQLEARFLVERQILASLNHPNISRLLDGGTSKTGLPYVVMEYLEGEPIDAYCARNRLSLRARLELMLQVCDAVQYAHEKLVIHRDLKPSNLLVTPEGEPKLLDFGIAKLLDPAASLPTLETVAGARPLTPEYASPEQLRGEAMDTASDVYSLGVLLYELLTGYRPVPLDTRDPLKIERELRDRTPTRPSAAVSGSSSPSPFPQLDAAAGFSEPPERRAVSLRGDLDVIILKALSFEPERRYGTASALANDLRNYLAERPIAARPDDWRYRAAKFVRRNRTSVVAGAAALLLLIAFAVTSSMMAVRLRNERDAVAEEQVRGQEMLNFLTQLFQDASPSGSLGRELTASEMLERGRQRLPELAGDLRLRSTLARRLGNVHRERGDYEIASELMEMALEAAAETSDPLTVALIRADYSLLETDYGNLERAEQMLVGSIGVLEEIGTKEDYLYALTSLGHLRHTQGDYEAAREVLEDVIERLEGLGDNPHDAYNNLAQAESSLGRYDRAIELQKRSLTLGEEALGASHPLIAVRLNNLGSLHADLGQMEDAERAYLAALEMQRSLYPDGRHPDLATTQNNLGVLYSDLERWEDARSSVEAAISITEQAFGPSHSSLSNMYNNLNLPMRRLGFPKESETALLKAIEIAEAVEGPASLSTAIYKNNLARFYESVSNLPRARQLQTECLQSLRAFFDGPHPYVAMALANLGSIEADAGDTERAIELVEESLEVHAAAGSPPNSTAMAYYNLGSHLLTLERTEEALPPLQTAYDQFAGFQDAGHTQRGRAALRLAEALLLTNRGEPQELLEEALQAFGEDRVSEQTLDDARVALALVLGRGGERERANELLQRAEGGSSPDSPLLSAARLEVSPEASAR
ncbi:MAG: serine/threonine-protein kinase [Acidobacteriota bacterium]